MIKIEKLKSIEGGKKLQTIKDEDNDID